MAASVTEFEEDILPGSLASMGVQSHFLSEGYARSAHASASVAAEAIEKRKPHHFLPSYSNFTFVQGYKPPSLHTPNTSYTL